MARNGSGTFIRLYSWEQDAANNIRIRADRMDNEMDGMADALTGSIATDGQTPVTANLPMSGFKHTNVADATQRNQYATWGQTQDNTSQWGGTDTGEADAYEIATTPVTTGYSTGQTFRFKVGSGHTNTGAATISVNGLPTRNLKDQDGNDPVAGAIRAGGVYEVTYDGTNFFLNPAFDYADNLSIQKAAASLDIGKGGFVGPHTVDFYDADDSIGVSWVYDTGNEELTAELSDGTELLKLDKSGVLTTGQIALEGDIVTNNSVNIEMSFTGGLDVRTLDNDEFFIFRVLSAGEAERFRVEHGAPLLRGQDSGWTINGNDIITEADAIGFTSRDVLTGSGNWTVPSGVSVVRVTLVGGGGGGGTGDNGGSSGGSTSFGAVAGANGGGGASTSIPGNGGNGTVANGGCGIGDPNSATASNGINAHIGGASIFGGGGIRNRNNQAPGSGGAGGTGESNGTGFGGGAGGANIQYLSVSPGSSISYSCGAGGSGGGSGGGGVGADNGADGQIVVEY